MKNWFRALIIQLILQCLYKSVYSISTTYTTYLEGHFETTTGSYSTINDQFGKFPINCSFIILFGNRLMFWTLLSFIQKSNVDFFIFDNLGDNFTKYLHKIARKTADNKTSEILFGKGTKFNAMINWLENVSSHK